MSKGADCPFVLNYLIQNVCVSNSLEKQRYCFFPKQRVGFFTVQHNKDNVSVKGKDQAGSLPIIKIEVSQGWGFSAVAQHPPGLLCAALGQLGKQEEPTRK